MNDEETDAEFAAINEALRTWASRLNWCTDYEEAGL